MLIGYNLLLPVVEVLFMSQFPVEQSCEGKTIPFAVDANLVLRQLPDREAFYFSDGQGQPTGVKAVSLEDFADKVLEIEAPSLSYHYYRGDFENWARDILSDPVLAFKLSPTNKSGLEGELLREYIKKQVVARISALKPKKSQHIIIKFSTRQ